MVSLNLNPVEIMNITAVVHQMNVNPVLEASLVEVTLYNPQYPDSSDQSLESIFAEPGDMQLQVDSYNAILTGLGLPPLGFSSGVFLYFALQGQILPIGDTSCSRGHGS